MASQSDAVLLSGAVYPGGVVPSGWTKLNVANSTSSVPQDGFLAAAYKNSNTGEVVVAFAGTTVGKDAYSIGTLGADYALEAAQTPAAFNEALRFAQAVQQNYGSTSQISLTGHSLGGAEAEYVAGNTNLGGTTFGAPGIAGNFVSNNLTNIVDRGDPVGNFAADGPIYPSGLTGNTHVGNVTYTGGLLNQVALSVGSRVLVPLVPSSSQASALLATYLDPELYVASVALFAVTLIYHRLDHYANAVGAQLPSGTPGSDGNLATSTDLAKLSVLPMGQSGSQQLAAAKILSDGSLDTPDYNISYNADGSFYKVIYKTAVVDANGNPVTKQPQSTILKLNGNGAVVSTVTTNADNTVVAQTFDPNTNTVVAQTTTDATGRSITEQIQPDGVHIVASVPAPGSQPAGTFDLTPVYQQLLNTAGASGQYIGAQLALLVAGNNQLVNLATSASLSTAGLIIGQEVKQQVLTGQNLSSYTIGSDFEAAASSAIGGYAGGQAGAALFRSIGIDPGVGRVVGSYIGGAVTLAAVQYLSGIEAQTINGVASASYLSDLSTDLFSAGALEGAGVAIFEQVSGFSPDVDAFGGSPEDEQIGSSIGGLIGTIVASGNPIGTVVGQFVGSIIGSAFGEPSVGPNATDTIGVHASSNGQPFTVSYRNSDNHAPSKEVAAVDGLGDAVSSYLNAELNALGAQVQGAPTPVSVRVLQNQLWDALEDGTPATHDFPNPTARSFGGGQTSYFDALNDATIRQLQLTQFSGGDATLMAAMRASFTAYDVNYAADAGTAAYAAQTVDQLNYDLQAASDFALYQQNPVAFLVGYALQDPANAQADWAAELNRAEELSNVTVYRPGMGQVTLNEHDQANQGSRGLIAMDPSLDKTKVSIARDTNNNLVIAVADGQGNDAIVVSDMFDPVGSVALSNTLGQMSFYAGVDVNATKGQGAQKDYWTGIDMAALLAGRPVNSPITLGSVQRFDDLGGTAGQHASENLTQNGTITLLHANYTDLVVKGDGDTVAVTGVADTIAITGTSDVVRLGNSDGLQASGTQMVVTVSGSNDTLQLNSDHYNLVANGDGSSIALNGGGSALVVNGQNNGIALNGLGNTLTVNGNGDGISLHGNNNTVTVNGTAGNTITVYSTGSTIQTGYSTVLIANTSQETINGSYDTIGINDAANLTLTGTNHALTLSGVNSTANATIADSTLVERGTGNTVLIDGDRNRATLGGGGNTLQVLGVDAVVAASGTGQVLQVSGGSVSLAAGAQVTMNGTAHNVAGVKDYGNGNMVTLAQGAGVDISGSQNFVQLTGNDTATLRDRNETVFATGTGNAVTLTGTGNWVRMSNNTLTLGSGAQAVLTGENDLVNASGKSVAFATPTVPAGTPFATRAVAYDSYSNGGFATAAAAASMQALAATGANTVQLVTVEYVPNLQGTTVAADPAKTESDASLETAIQNAENDGLAVTLKPHLNSATGEWQAHLAPSDVGTFFASYQAYIMHEAQIAQQTGVQMFSIGDEMSSLDSNANDTGYWTSLINAVRAVYTGKLTYAAAYDDAAKVTFWNQVDVIGTNPYEALPNPETGGAPPTVADLVNDWTNVPNTATRDANGNAQTPVAFYQALSAKYGKQIQFTEVGYQSVNDTLATNGDSNTNPAHNYPSYQQQATALQAFFEAFNGKTWLDGATMWEWNPDPARVLANDFSPQNKPALAVVDGWYGSDTRLADASYAVGTAPGLTVVGQTATLAGGGNAVAAVAGDALHFTNTAGTPDTVSANNVTGGTAGLFLDANSQVNVNGTGNAITLAAGVSSHVAGGGNAITAGADDLLYLTDTNTQPDVVTASGVSGTTAIGQAAAIALGGNTQANITGRNDVITLAAGCSSHVSGGGNTITVGANDLLYLTDTNTQPDVVTANGVSGTTALGQVAEIAVGGSTQANVTGNNNTIVLSSGASSHVSGGNNAITAGANDLLYLTDTNGQADRITANGVSGTTALGQAAQIAVGGNTQANVTGNNNVISLSTGCSSQVSGGGNTIGATGNDLLYITATNGTADTVNASNVTGATALNQAAQIALGSNAQANINGNSDAIGLATNSVAGVYGTQNTIAVGSSDYIALGGGTITDWLNVSGQQSTLQLQGNTQATIAAIAGANLNLLFSAASSASALSVSSDDSGALTIADQSGDKAILTGMLGAGLAPLAGVKLSNNSVLSAQQIVAADASVANIGGLSNLFNFLGSDAILRFASGKVVACEFDTNGAVLKSVTLAAQGTASTVPANCTFVGVAQNLLNKGGHDLIERTASGQAVVWEIDDNGAVLSTLALTQNGTAFNGIGVNDTFIGGGQNLLGNGNHDLFQRTAAGQLVIWDFDDSGAVTTKTVPLPSNWTLDQGSKILGIGRNLLSKGGYDMLVRNPSGQVGVWEYDGSNATGLWLTNAGAAATVSAGAAAIGYGSNGLGSGGQTLYLRSGTGTLVIWEFDTTGALTVTGTPSLPAGWTLDQYTRVLGSGHNLLGTNGYDMVMRNSSGQIGIWEYNGSSSSGIWLKNGSMPATVSAGALSIGYSFNALGSGRPTLYFRSNTGTLVIWEFDANGNLTKTASTPLPPNWTLSPYTRVLGSAENLLGTGSFDTVVRSSTGQVGVWESDGNSSTGIWLTNAGAAANVSTSALLIGSAFNALGSGGQTLYHRSYAGALIVWEFDANGKLISTQSPTLPSGWTLDQNTTVVGSGQNLLGSNGRDAIIRNGVGQLGIWEYSAGNASSGRWLTYGGAPVYFGLGATVIGQGRNFNAAGGNDLFIRTASGTLAAWEFNSSGAISTKGLALPSGTTSLNQGAAFIGTGANLLGKGGNDVFVTNASGQLSLWEYGTDGSLLQASGLYSGSSPISVGLGAAIVATGTNASTGKPDFSVKLENGTTQTYDIAAGTAPTYQAAGRSSVSSANGSGTNANATTGTAKQSVVLDTGVVSTDRDDGSVYVVGTTGADHLVGTTGGDVFDGQGSTLGFDLVQGQGGGDTFLYNLGYGALEIDETDAGDTPHNVLQFGAGIGPANLSVVSDQAGDLLLSDGKSGDLVTIDGMLNGSANGVQQIHFLDGSVWTKDQIRFLAANGSIGNDTITGTAGDDVFDGKGGNDVEIGGGGNDSYIFRQGYGQLLIENGTPTATGSDQQAGMQATGTLDFGTGLTENNLWFSQDNNDLDITVLGSADRITIQNWFTDNASAALSDLVAGDGMRLDRSDVGQLVSAMASYQAAHPEFSPATAQMPTDAGLQNSIVSYWHS